MTLDIGTILEKAESASRSPAFYETCRTILIYGAGQVGRDALRAMSSRGVKVRGYLDRRADSLSQCDGLPVYPPAWDGIPHPEREQTGVVVAVHNRDVEVAPIIEHLRDRGYGRVVTLVEFFDHFSEPMGERFWLTSRASYREWARDIVEGHALWDDEHSRQLYAGLLDLRLDADYAGLPRVHAERQYFPGDVPAWATSLRFVDGGAFDGDTLASIMQSTYSLEAVAAFEPDPASFGKLRNRLSSISCGQAYLWPCGVYSVTGQSAFAASGLESSSMADSAAITVQMVALDDVIPTFKPNLIKLDVEGAEYEGLLGARRIIRENRPGLAICLYHRPRDMWRVPLLVRSWDLGYRFFMRAHSYNGFELVMYAIPARS